MSSGSQNTEISIEGKDGVVEEKRRAVLPNPFMTLKHLLCLKFKDQHLRVPTGPIG